MNIQMRVHMYSDVHICTQNIHNLSIRSQASEEERRIRNRVKVHTDRT